jgi:hypothetical protein
MSEGFVGTLKGGDEFSAVPRLDAVPILESNRTFDPLESLQ